MADSLSIFQIAVGLLALITLVQWLAPNPVRLRVLVKQEEVRLPSEYSEYLRSLDMDRDALGRVHDAASAASKQEKSPFSGMVLERPLAAIRAFSGSVPIFRSINPRIITVKIANLGWKPATNVKVFSPNAGFVEITKDDAMVGSAQKKVGLTWGRWNRRVSLS